MNQVVAESQGTFNQIWHIALAPGQYWTVLAVEVLTALSLAAFFIWGIRQQARVDPRYHSAIRAGLTVSAVAGLSYLLNIYKLLVCYSLVSGLYMPSSNGLLDVPARYIDWSINVPLLVVEIIGVSALTIGRATILRLVGGVSALAMILVGYLGEIATPSGLSGRVGWGVLSSVFFVIVYAIVIYTVFKSTPELSQRENRIYRRAMVVLLAVWFVYPIVYGINGFATGAAWATSAQLAYSVADVIAKVGFGVMVFRLALLRSGYAKSKA